VNFFNFASPTTIGGVISLLLNILAIAILIRALLSWVSPDPRNPIVQALDAITEPILQPLRQVMPRMGGIDLTPMVAIVVLSIMANVAAQVITF
jgi:YggT family protein